MKMLKNLKRDLPKNRFEIGPHRISNSDLSETETQDNVSMHNFKNTLTAFVRQAEGGEKHNGKEGC
jgi:hypothetical protein